VIRRKSTFYHLFRFAVLIICTNMQTLEPSQQPAIDRAKLAKIGQTKLAHQARYKIYKRLYDAAIVDAKTPLPSEIYTQLRSAAPWNKNNYLKNFQPAGIHILVATIVPRKHVKSWEEHKKKK